MQYDDEVGSEFEDVEGVMGPAALAGDDTIVVLNPAPAAALPDALLAHLDVITPNEHEEQLLGGAEALLKRGVGAVVVTEGARGARLVTSAGITAPRMWGVEANYRF